MQPWHRPTSSQIVTPQDQTDPSDPGGRGSNRAGIPLQRQVMKTSSRQEKDESISRLKKWRCGLTERQKCDFAALPMKVQNLLRSRVPEQLCFIYVDRLWSKVKRGEKETVKYCNVAFVQWPQSENDSFISSFKHLQGWFHPLFMAWLIYF